MSRVDALLGWFAQPTVECMAEELLEQTEEMVSDGRRVVLIHETGVKAYRGPLNKWFVPDPSRRGRYLMVDQNVLESTCGVCGSGPGIPCRNPTTGEYWTGSGHGDRSRWRRMRRGLNGG